MSQSPQVAKQPPAYSPPTYPHLSLARLFLPSHQRQNCWNESMTNNTVDVYVDSSYVSIISSASIAVTENVETLSSFTFNVNDEVLDPVTRLTQSILSSQAIVNCTEHRNTTLTGAQTQSTRNNQAVYLAAATPTITRTQSTGNPQAVSPAAATPTNILTSGEHRGGPNGPCPSPHSPLC